MPTISSDVDPDAGLVIYTNDEVPAASPGASETDGLPLLLYGAVAAAALAVIVVVAVLFYRAQARKLRAALADGTSGSGGELSAGAGAPSSSAADRPKDTGGAMT
jgi:hypothetical protein